MKTHYQVLVIGGGNAGLSVSAYLLRKNSKLDVAVMEPSDKHYYQPAWTLVGAGIYPAAATVKNEAGYIPKNCTWIREAAAAFDPENKTVVTQQGNKYSYDYLVVCPGIQLNWKEIKGLKETLGKNGVTSNYSFEHAPYTFECIRNYKSGPAIFHNPHTPMKCGGAPHKIMYLAADYFRKHNISKTDIQYWSGGTRLFGIDKYEKTLLEIVARNNIQLNFHVKLDAVDGNAKQAYFTGIGTVNKNVSHVVDFEFIHITPPQGPPDFIRSSALAGNNGWVDVNIQTLQHNKYRDIFSLGDAAGLPTAKTGAAIRKQVPILVTNLIAQMGNRSLPASYDGYSSCPIVTGYGKLMLAEFDYQNRVAETFPFDQSRERRSMYFLKRHILPRLYWGAILKGKFQG